jgi:hypothetical protein
MSRIVNVLDYKFLIPKFVHKFGDLENHTFSGSLNRKGVVCSKRNFKLVR